LAQNGNVIVISLDTQAGGGVSSTVTLNAIPGYGVLGDIGGTRVKPWGTNTGDPNGPSVLSPGFNPDYALEINAGGNSGNYYIDVIDLTKGMADTNSARYLGSNTFGNAAVTHTYTYADASTHGTISHAFNGTNTAGVNGYGAATLGDPLSDTTGLELSFSADFLNRDPGQQIKLLAGVTNDNGYFLSNQFLPGLNGIGNLGYPGRGVSDPLFNASRFAGTSFFTVPTPWALTAGATWNSAASWGAGIPNDPGAQAQLLGAAATASAVTLDINATVGTLEFSNANRYTISGSNTLTLLGNRGTSTVLVDAGSHTIATAVSLGDAATLAVNNTASVLTISGNISGPGSLTKTGGGAAVLGGTNIYGGGTTVNGGVLTFSSTAARPASDVLTLGSSGSPVKGGTVVVTGDAANLDATYRTQLLAGLTSSTGPVIKGAAVTNEGVGYLTGSEYNALHPGNTLGLGANDMVLKYTYLGDVALKGFIDASDFAQIDASWLKGTYATSGAHWINGDFNYDGKIDSADFAILDAAYSAQAGGLANDPFLAGNAALLGLSVPAYASLVTAQAPLGVAAVPEPASLALLGLGTVALWRRRKSK
ncbi:MAG: PEP-CTERM sorting domain-containing protein, partial [Phycisphaerae bacterium]